jgi:predicted component of type VI protein secretion system
MKKISSLLLIALIYTLVISACVPVPPVSNDSIQTMVVMTLTAAASQLPAETATPQPTETQVPPRELPLSDLMISLMVSTRLPAKK